MKYVIILALLLSACTLEHSDSADPGTETIYYTLSECDWHADAYQPNLDYPAYCEDWGNATCCTWYADHGCVDEWCYWYDICDWEHNESDC